MKLFFSKPGNVLSGIAALVLTGCFMWLVFASGIFSPHTFLSEQNFEAIRSASPAGLIYASQITMPYDLCPNIIGVQNTLPIGKIVDGVGNCVSSSSQIFYNTAISETWGSASGIGFDVTFATPAGVVASTKSQQDANLLAKYSVTQAVSVDRIDIDMCPTNIPGIQISVPEGHYWTGTHCFPIKVRTTCAALPTPAEETRYDAFEQSAAVYNACPGSGVPSEFRYYIGVDGREYPAYEQNFNQGINTHITENGLTLHVMIPPRIMMASQEGEYSAKIVSSAIHGLMIRNMFSPNSIAQIVASVLEAGGGGSGASSPVSQFFGIRTVYAAPPATVDGIVSIIDRIVAAILTLDPDRDGNISLREANDNLRNLKLAVDALLAENGATQAERDKAAGKFNAGGTGLNIFMLFHYPGALPTPTILTKEELNNIKNRLVELINAADENHNGVLEPDEYEKLKKMIYGVNGDPKMNAMLNALCKAFVKKLPDIASKVPLSNKICDEKFPIKKDKQMEAEEQSGPPSR
jgi:hypothetical protein